MPWIMSLLGVTATLLNANQIVWCFALYVVTNIYWTWHNAKIKEYAQASLCFIYLLISVWGFNNWR